MDYQRWPLQPRQPADVFEVDVAQVGEASEPQIAQPAAAVVGDERGRDAGEEGAAAEEELLEREEVARHRLHRAVGDGREHLEVERGEAAEVRRH